MPTINKIKETCLYVSDLDQSFEFYENKLGLKCFTHNDGRHVFFEAGDTVLLCFLSESTRDGESLPSHYGEGYMHLAFECPEEDYESRKEQVETAGIEIEHVESWGGEQESFYFRDPDGHLLEVIKPGLWKHLIQTQ